MYRMDLRVWLVDGRFDLLSYVSKFRITFMLSSFVLLEKSFPEKHQYKY